jgi:hypothetical protein
MKLKMSILGQRSNEEVEEMYESIDQLVADKQKSDNQKSEVSQNDVMTSSQKTPANKVQLRNTNIQSDLRKKAVSAVVGGPKQGDGRTQANGVQVLHSVTNSMYIQG